MPVNPNASVDAAAKRHILRRMGFGVTDRDERVLEDATTRGACADELLDFRPSKKRLNAKRRDSRHNQNQWLHYIVAGRTTRCVQEKLVVFWHDHFAVSQDTVGDRKVMGHYNRTLRIHCKGDFKTFVRAINLDPAMMDFLDTVRNHKNEPNENYARELCELFTLGVVDLNGQPNYTELDVQAIARAFTGWRADFRRRRPFFSENRHDFEEDFPERGEKRLFTEVGGFGAAGRTFNSPEGETEIDQVVDAIFDHTDSDGANTVARHIAWKLLRYYCHDDVTKAQVDEVVAASSFDTTWDLTALLRAIISSDVFYDTAAPAPFDAGTKRSVKWPIDYVASTLRVCQMKLHRQSQIRGVSGQMRQKLENMGQVLFRPPSVFGWDWEAAWVSSTTMLARYDFATDVVAAGRRPNRRGRFPGGRKTFQPERLVDFSLTDPGAIVDQVTRLLGVDHQITAAERQTFIDYLTDDGANPTIDLTDEAVELTKLRGLFVAVMQSPWYQVH